MQRILSLVFFLNWMFGKPMIEPIGRFRVVRWVRIYIFETVVGGIVVQRMDYKLNASYLYNFETNRKEKLSEDDYYYYY